MGGYFIRIYLGYIEFLTLKKPSPGIPMMALLWIILKTITSFLAFHLHEA
jgi:hypothetical protein